MHDGGMLGEYERSLSLYALSPQRVVLQVPGLTKTSSDVKSVFFAKFEDCQQFCVVRCLQSYIDRTKDFRPPLAPNIACQLLLPIIDRPNTLLTLH